MENGHVRTFGALKGNDASKTIGIEYDGAALTGLPGEEAPPSDGRWDVVDADGNIVWYCCRTAINTPPKPTGCCH